MLSTGEIASALRQAERDPAALTDDQAIALLSADGADLEALAGLADASAATSSATTSPT